jgi:hypothetical protein
MSLKLKEKNKIIPSFETLMDDDSIVNDELSLLAFNIKKEVSMCWIFSSHSQRFMIRGKLII